MRADRARSVKARLQDPEAVNRSLELGGVPGKGRTHNLLHACAVKGCDGVASLWFGNAGVLLDKCKTCEEREGKNYRAKDVLTLAQLRRGWTWDQALEWAEQLAAAGAPQVKPAQPQPREEDEDADQEEDEDDEDEDTDDGGEDLTTVDLDPDDTPEEWATLERLGADPDALQGRSWIRVLDRGARQPEWAAHQGMTWGELGYTIVLRARRFGESRDCWAGLGADGQIKMPPGTGDWVLHNDVATDPQSPAISFCFGVDILKAGILPRTVWVFPAIQGGTLRDGEGGERSLIERRIGSRVRHLAKKLPAAAQITILRPNTARTLAGAADMDRELLRVWEQEGRRVKITPIERVLASICPVDREDPDDEGAGQVDAASDPLIAELEQLMGAAPAREALLPPWMVPAASSAVGPDAGPAFASPPAPVPEPKPTPAAPKLAPAPAARALPEAAAPHRTAAPAGVLAELARIAAELSAPDLAELMQHARDLSAGRRSGRSEGGAQLPLKGGSSGDILVDLREVLSCGPLPGAEATRILRQRGHLRPAIRAAKQDLGILVSGPDCSWSLPSPPVRLRSIP